MEVTLTTAIAGRRIADMMVTAIEGGSGYWCETINLLEGTALKRPWYDDETLYEQPFVIGVVDAEEPDSTIHLNQEMMKRGFELMASQYETTHWADFLEQNEDADTADVWLQLCVFGEVVYG